MKNIFLILLLFISLAGYGQDQSLGTKNNTVRVKGRFAIDTVHSGVNPGDTVLFQAPDGRIMRYKMGSGVILPPGIDSITFNPPFLCYWQENFPTCYDLGSKDTVNFEMPLQVVKKEESGAAHDSVKIAGSTPGYVLTSNGVNAPVTWQPSSGGGGGGGPITADYDSSSVNFDNTKYIFYNEGVAVDSVPIKSTVNLATTNLLQTDFNRRYNANNQNLSFVNLQNLQFTSAGSGFNFGPASIGMISPLMTIDAQNIYFKTGGIIRANIDPTGKTFIDSMYIGRGTGLGYNYGSVAVGHSALLSNATGHYNVAVGDSALRLNTTGDNNVGIGYKSGGKITTGNNNVGVGAQSLFNNVGGSNNVAFGVNALYSNISGTDNIAIGYAAGVNLTGINNIFIGRDAGQSSGAASYNTVVGHQAFLSNSSGGSNTVVGALALGSSTAGSNTAIGTQAGSQNSSGSNNTIIGAQGMYYNTTGSNNATLGLNAGKFLADGSTQATLVNNSTFIGYNAYPLANNQTNQIAIGYTAVGLGSNTTVIGNSSTLSTGLYGGVSIGTGSLFAAVPSAQLEVISSSKGFLPPRMTGGQMNAIGSPASGLMVYNTDSLSYCYFDGTVWNKIGSGGGGGGTGYLPLTGGTVSGNLGINTVSAVPLHVVGTVPLLAKFERSNSSGGVNIIDVYNPDLTNNNSALIAFSSNTTGTGATSDVQLARIGGVFVNHDHATRQGGINFFTSIGNGSNSVEVARFAPSGALLLNTITDIPSSSFTMGTTTKGMLLPRLTTIQQNAIASPATGLQIWNSDSLCTVAYNGTRWRKIATSIDLAAKMDTANALPVNTTTLTAGDLLQFNGTDFVNVPVPFKYNTDSMRFAPLSVSLSGSNFTTTGAAMTPVTGMSISAAANKKYRLTMELFTACDNTGGIIPGFTAPSGAVMLSGSYTATGTTVQAVVGQRVGAFGATIPIALNTRAGTGFVKLTAYFTTSATAGTLQLTVRSQTAGQLTTIETGSTMEIQEVL